MLRGWGSSLRIFPRKAGLSLHFSDSKSDYPRSPVMEVGGGGVQMHMTGALNQHHLSQLYNIF